MDRSRQELVRLRRFSEIGGWVLVLGGLGIAAGFVHFAHDDPQASGAAGDRSSPQAALDADRSPVWSLAFSPDDTALASATITGDVWFEELNDGRRSGIQRGPMGTAQSLAFSADGRILAVAGIGPVIRLWDLEAGKECDPLQPESRSNCGYVAFSRDGKYAAVGGSDGILTLWDWASQRRLMTRKGHRAGIHAVSFSRDGTVLATGDSDGLVKMWDLPGGRERTSFRTHPAGNGITSVAFSPDGVLLATSSFLECTVRLWSAVDGRNRRTLPKMPLGVKALAFSPDGALLAMARGDGAAVLWGVAEDRELASVRANERGLESLAFSRDGRMLATGGMDGGVRLWDVARALVAGRPSENPNPNKLINETNILN